MECSHFTNYQKGIPSTLSLFNIKIQNKKHKAHVLQTLKAMCYSFGETGMTEDRLKWLYLRRTDANRAWCTKSHTNYCCRSHNPPNPQNRHSRTSHKQDWINQNIISILKKEDIPIPQSTIERPHWHLSRVKCWNTPFIVRWLDTLATIISYVRPNQLLLLTTWPNSSHWCHPASLRESLRYKATCEALIQNGLPRCVWSHQPVEPSIPGRKEGNSRLS